MFVMAGNAQQLRWLRAASWVRLLRIARHYKLLF